MWNWDITDLPTTVRSVYFCFYLVIDVWSRLPGPLASAKRLRTATLESRLEELGVLRSFSRPRVSNDNPSDSLLGIFKAVVSKKFNAFLDYLCRPFHKC